MSKFECKIWQIISRLYSLRLQPAVGRLYSSFIIITIIITMTTVLVVIKQTTGDCHLSVIYDDDIVRSLYTLMLWFEVIYN
jgi:hypothetical protein